MSLPAQQGKAAVLAVLTPLGCAELQDSRSVRTRQERTCWDSTGSSKRRILEREGGEMLKSQNHLYLKELVKSNCILHKGDTM